MEREVEQKQQQKQQQQQKQKQSRMLSQARTQRQGCRRWSGSGWLSCGSRLQQARQQASCLAALLGSSCSCWRMAGAISTMAGKPYVSGRGLCLPHAACWPPEDGWCCLNQGRMNAGRVCCATLPSPHPCTPPLGRGRQLQARLPVPYCLPPACAACCLAQHQPCCPRLATLRPCLAALPPGAMCAATELRCALLWRPSATSR